MACRVRASDSRYEYEKQATTASIGLAAEKIRRFDECRKQ